MPIKVWILAFVLAGPALVSPDLQAMGPNGSAPTNFVSLGGRALFFSNTGLWASDGTAAGTVRLTEEHLGGFLAVGTNVAYLIGDSPEPARNRLWVTDGTPVGTFPLVRSGLSFRIRRDFPAFLVPRTERLFFSAEDELHGSEVWTSDGTPEGTRMVADLLSGSGSSNPFAFTGFRHRIFFAADGGRGHSLWSMDEAGTRVRLVKDPEPFQYQTASPYFLAVAGRNLFFFYSSSDGTFLWKSDGTGPGTVPLAKLLPATAPAGGVQNGVVQLDRLFFVLLEGDNRFRLWTSNGTPAGTRRLALAGQAQASASFPPQLPGKPLLFAAGDEVHGLELWISNGTQAGTRLLKDVCPGSCSGYASFHAVSIAGRDFFVGKTPARGDEVWSTDATEAGTRLVKDVCPGRCDSRSTAFTPVGGLLYFFARDAHGQQLWRTDGTATGTLRLSEFPSFPFNEVVRGAAAGPFLVFRGYDLSHGRELWRSRGTPQTTRFLAETRFGDLYP